MKGTVRFFNTQKGYGFIRSEEGNDIFVHYTGINVEGFKNLEKDQIVEFDLSDGKKGKQAVNVTMLNEVVTLGTLLNIVSKHWDTANSEQKDLISSLILGDSEQVSVDEVINLISSNWDKLSGDDRKKMCIAFAGLNPSIKEE